MLPSNCRLIDAEEALFMGATNQMCPVLLLAFESWSFPHLEPLLNHCVNICLNRGGIVAEEKKIKKESVRLNIFFSF